MKMHQENASAYQNERKIAGGPTLMPTPCKYFIPKMTVEHDPEYWLWLVFFVFFLRAGWPKIRNDNKKHHLMS